MNLSNWNGCVVLAWDGHYTLQHTQPVFDYGKKCIQQKKWGPVVEEVETRLMSFRNRSGGGTTNLWGWRCEIVGPTVSGVERFQKHPLISQVMSSNVWFCQTSRVKHKDITICHHEPTNIHRPIYICIFFFFLLLFYIFLLQLLTAYPLWQMQFLQFGQVTI